MKNKSKLYNKIIPCPTKSIYYTVLENLEKMGFLWYGGKRAPLLGVHYWDNIDRKEDMHLFIDEIGISHGNSLSIDRENNSKYSLLTFAEFSRQYGIRVNYKRVIDEALETMFNVE